MQASADDERTMLLEGIPEPAFGFHAQQAIEKLLKALLDSLGRKYPRIHQLEKIETALAEAGERLPAVPVKLDDLTLYALDYRYGEPLPPEPLNRDDVTATVRIIREFVHRRVQELDAHP